MAEGAIKFKIDTYSMYVHSSETYIRHISQYILLVCKIQLKLRFPQFFNVF